MQQRPIVANRLDRKVCTSKNIAEGDNSTSRSHNTSKQLLQLPTLSTKQIYQPLRNRSEDERYVLELANFALPRHVKQSLLQSEV